MKRTATAVWSGSIKEGNGKISTQSTLLDNAQYAYKSRFEEEKGTNPDELIAAAHAGCFAMALSLILGEAGHTPGSLEVKAEVVLKPETLDLTASHLTLKANVPGIDKKTFEECAQKAKTNCPVSKVLNLDITLEASLQA